MGEEQVLISTATDGTEFYVRSNALIYIEGNGDNWRIQSSRRNLPRVWTNDNSLNYPAHQMKAEIPGTKFRVYRVQVDTAGGIAFVYRSKIDVFR